MAKKYTVTDEFMVGSGKVVALDSPQAVEDFNSTAVVVDGIRYPFEFTHNDLWIVVRTTARLLGKELSFVE